MIEQVQMAFRYTPQKYTSKVNLKRLQTKEKKKQQNTIVHKKNQKYHKRLRKALIIKSGETRFHDLSKQSYSQSAIYFYFN